MIAVSLIFCIVLVEFSIYFLTEKGILRIDRPAYSMNRVHRFWADIIRFRCLHESHSELSPAQVLHGRGEQANPYGARDPKENRIATAPDGVLGDSFVEGYGVSRETLSDLLERPESSISISAPPDPSAPLNISCCIRVWRNSSHTTG